MDALLGALALGDIGQHFPDSDERYRGADSRQLLRHVHEKVREQLRVGNQTVQAGPASQATSLHRGDA